MANIKESAEAYTPQEGKNIAELERVSVNVEIVEGIECTDKEGKPFTVNEITVDEIKYRVPNMVLKQLKQHLKSRPDLEFFKVEKEGSGKNTSYTVIPL